jgi:hypothetical protein
VIGKWETAAIVITDNSFAEQLQRMAKELTGVYQ